MAFRLTAESLGRKEGGEGITRLYSVQPNIASFTESEKFQVFDRSSTEWQLLRRKVFNERSPVSLIAGVGILHHEMSQGY